PGTSAPEPAPAPGLAAPGTLPAAPALGTTPRPRPAPPSAPEQIIPAGDINFPAVDINQVFEVYAQLVDRTVLRPAALPAGVITLKTQTPLTKTEAIQALNAVLGMNGITMINVGDKFVKAVFAGEVPQAAQEWSTVGAQELPELGS